MRLTLRTLLAYLDDTLEPAETKLIGQKVAESAAAQELIERIKKVTRRRSLANPPVFGDESKLDPNTVAAYLSDVLPPEEVAEVEQTCLEHDMYLAEVAACHQILTLMLSEPVRVPPTARQRMYRLVKGRESIPYRKPPAFKPAVEMGDKFQQGEVKEPKPAKWPSYVAGALVLSAGLAFAIWLAWPERQQPVPLAPGNPPVANAAAIVVPMPSKPDKPKENATKVDPAKEPTKVDPPKEPAKIDPPKEPVRADPPKPIIGTVSMNEPSKDKREIGRMVSPGVVLVQKGNSGRASWPRVALDGRVSTGVDLIAMPGSRADVRLDNGLMVSFWGNVPELVDAPILESAATFHAPAEGLDADLTLDRGRVVVANPRAKPSMARLRFVGETWDIWLGEQAEVLIDLLRSYPGAIPFSKQPGGEGPMVELFLGVVKGKADVLRKDLPQLAGQAPGLIYWDNKKGEVRGPTRLKDLLPSWTPMPANRPESVQARAAQEEFAKRVAAKEADLEVVLSELQQDAKPANQALGAFGLGAVDAVPGVLDALDEPFRPALRAAAILTLRQWCARKGENDLALYALLRNKKNYNETDADKFLELLHSYSGADARNPRTYQALIADLNHGKLTIRTLAFWHLAQLDPDGVKTTEYDPDADDSVRDKAIGKWRRRIPSGKMPPKPMGAP